jgi:hypothetical protein
MLWREFSAYLPQMEVGIIQEYAAVVSAKRRLSWVVKIRVIALFPNGRII